MLGLLVDFEGKRLSICAIYGPNRVQESFFTDIRSCLAQFNNRDIIIGGDWNTTVSCANDESNIDTLNMRNPPNLRHSLLLKKMCEELELSDPYRVKFQNRREFTYRPSVVLKTNRSRIDFFITSNHLTERIRKCFISNSLQNKLFDHRATHICFKKQTTGIRTPTISREILKDPDIDLVVKISIYETYAHHSNTITERDRQETLLRLGTARRDLRESGPDSSTLPAGFRTEFDELRRSGILAGIKETLNDFRIADYSAGGFRDGLSDDIFMETLVNNLKNDVVSYQHFISKTIKNSTLVMSTELARLKKDYERNTEEIFSLENKIDKIQDLKMHSKLETSKNFEILNSERITPNFINLSKGAKSEACLSDLKDDANNPFETDEHMKIYVRDFYKNLYKSPPCDVNFNENCINEFLGEDIIQSRLVQDSVIPEQLSQEFELPISLAELDVSAEQGNKSASGMDSLSNCFIKKYWELLRIPLHRYASHCHGTGKLTQNFSTASIKLIPKKGDPAKIKNWRPISLLSCLYKAISRALNNRLKKASGYIFSRAQKGFRKF